MGEPGGLPSLTTKPKQAFKTPQEKTEPRKTRKKQTFPFWGVGSNPQRMDPCPRYGFRIHTASGLDVVKMDPYAQEFEVPSDLHHSPALRQQAKGQRAEVSLELM